MMLAFAFALFLHLLAATFWVGGMATMHFCVRPAAAAKLPPPLRLPFMAAALARLFDWVGAAIVVLLVSGLAMIWIAGGFAIVHWGVHVMFALGLLMMALYVYIRWWLYPPLCKAISAADWPKAGGWLNHIRQLVLLNLLLGVLVFAVATLARAV